MAAPPVRLTQVEPNEEKQNYQFALTALTSLFFIWGFITCLNDILIPHLKSVFELSYVQAMLVQFCFFGAYFLVSLPAGKLVKKYGYQKGIVYGLLVAALGCALFYPAAQYFSYGLFLFALFVLASGITILQVSANPYVSMLGSAKTASSRLTLTQAFNSLGTTVAPYFGALLILDQAIENVATVNERANAVQMPYLLLASMLIILAAIFIWLKLPNSQQLIAKQKYEQSEQKITGTAWQHRHLVLGAVGIFMYVGA